MKSSKTPLNWLRTFEAAARHLSLSGAASELNVTPAAVSQQMRLLELRLGERLFVRHARGLRLTSAGEALLVPCRESFGRLDSALADLFGHRERRQLVIRVPLGFAREWLLNRVAEFSNAHPEIPIRLLATVWAGEVLDSTADIDFRIASAPAPGLESHQLTQDELFPVCSPTLAQRSRRIRRPSDVCDYPLLTTIGFAQGWRHWFAAAGVHFDQAPVSTEFDSMRLALEMAAVGRGIALARTSYVDDLLRSHRLKRLFKVRLETTDNIYLTLGRGLDPQAPASQFRDWMLSQK